MYDTRFNAIIDFIFKSEGGYSNDKADPGGPTNFGITQETYNSWNTRQNKPIKDVKGITKEEAKEIYYKWFWKDTGASEIKDIKMAYLVFDSAILCGPYAAKTFYNKSNGDINKFLDERKQYHIKNIQNGKSDPKWQEGWNKRVEDLKRNTEIIEFKHKEHEIKEKFHKSFPKKYDEKTLGNMSLKEYSKKRDEIEEELLLRQNKIKKMQEDIKKAKAQYISSKKEGLTGSASSINSGFENVSLNGRKWEDWTSLERESFLEGFITNRFTNNTNWTNKFNTGNPDTDDGHWITLPNKKHLFIKDC